MKPTPLKRAILKQPDGRIDELILFRRERGDFRWVFPADGKEFDGVAYLTEEDAIRQLRVKVDGEPGFVGWDLTVKPIDPPPDIRAAERVADAKVLLMGGVGFIRDEAVQAFAQIIREETRIDELLDAYQTLLAFLLQRRHAYAKALFPSVDGQEPRDLTLDGLILTAIEATEKATQQSHDNLKKPLMEPVSRIVTAHGVRKKGPVQ